MGLPDIKDVKLYEPGKVYLYKGDWKSPVVKLDLTATEPKTRISHYKIGLRGAYSKLKEEMERA